MNYSFYIREVSGLKVFSIKSNQEFLVLERFTDANWTPNKIQKIIEEIYNSVQKPKKEEYVWASEDLTLYSNINGVLLIDDISQRNGENDPEKLNLGLFHEEFTQFLNDFKIFIQENS